MREINSINRGRAAVMGRLRYIVLMVMMLVGTLSVSANNKPNERDSVLCSTTLYFLHNSVWFDYANESEIFELLDTYTHNVNSILQIEAWCDGTGTEMKNEEISLMRAKNVRKFFRRYGVIARDISLVRGNGVDRGAATDSLARRAEVELVVRVVNRAPKHETVEPEVTAVVAEKKQEAEPQPQPERAADSEVAAKPIAVSVTGVTPSVTTPTLAVASTVESTIEQPAASDVYTKVVSSGRGDDFKRFDRRVDHSIKYAYKGEFLMGASVSYGEIESENSEVMLLLEGIDASGDMLTVKPFVGYFYKDNRCVGLRFGYSTLGGELGSASVNLGESNDINFDIPYVSLRSKSYSAGLFHRSYVGLDRAGRAGLFAEIELSGVKSEGETAYEASSDVIERSSSKSISAELSFNPGVAVYVMPNVCATLSFGFGGLNYKAIDQYDAAGNRTGGRIYSKMSFKFNVTAINFGMNIHLWGK